jgi:hypothetical protein
VKVCLSSVAWGQQEGNEHSHLAFEGEEQEVLLRPWISHAELAATYQIRMAIFG